MHKGEAEKAVDKVRVSELNERHSSHMADTKNADARARFLVAQMRRYTQTSLSQPRYSVTRRAHSTTRIATSVVLSATTAPSNRVDGAASAELVLTGGRLPASVAPLVDVRALHTEGGVVAVARIEPRLVRERVEDAPRDVTDELPEPVGVALGVANAAREQ